jgi:hypothetical protein
VRFLTLAGRVNIGGTTGNHQSMAVFDIDRSTCITHDGRKQDRYSSRSEDGLDIIVR